MKLPAFTSLTPSEPRYSTLDSLSRQKLFQLLPEISNKNNTEKMETSHSWPYGFYRSLTDNLFFKILPASSYPAEKFALELEEYLYKQGMPGRKGRIYQKNLEGDSVCVIIYPYITAKFFDSSENHIISLAQHLKGVHQALSHFPQAKKVKLEWQHRLETFKTILRYPEQYQIPIAARQAIEKYRHLFEDLIQQPAQIVHGDLNFGNVLFVEGRAQIIDYETACYSWLPVDFDLAMVIERFCLNTHSPELAKRLSLLFLRTYKSSPFNVADRLICVSLRSLLVLSDYLHRDLSFPKQEWSKFIRLIHHSQTARSWLTNEVEKNIW
ncbi:MAG: phosphotransferase [Desulfonatronovibrio sp.]